LILNHAGRVMQGTQPRLVSGTATAAGAERRDGEANYFAMSLEWFPATLDLSFAHLTENG
jgi:hypothetical protein